MGAVSVVVDNNGAISAPMQVQLQPYAPAFFMDPGTTYAIASRLPDYVVVGTGVDACTSRGHARAVGYGLRATTPAVPAGVAVSGAPATPFPTITVGGVPATVIGSVLAPSSAGVYQIAIQLPSNVPTGNVALRASIGGAQTPSGTTIVVAAQ